MRSDVEMVIKKEYLWWVGWTWDGRGDGGIRVGKGCVSRT